MPAIAATDVSYSALKVKKLEDGRKLVQATISFGDGVLTYPAGGIPLTGAKLACPVSTDSLLYDDAANGNTNAFKHDLANNKIRIYVETAGTYAEMSGAVPALVVKAVAIGY